ncbi:hypothetical protein M3J09_009355 [Ascochyta lentis]
MSHPHSAQPQQQQGMQSHTNQFDTTAGFGLPRYPSSGVSVPDAQKTSNTRRDSARGSQSTVPSGAAQRPSEPSVAEEDIPYVPVQATRPTSEHDSPHFRPPQWTHGMHQPLATSQYTQQPHSREQKEILDALADALQLPLSSIPETTQPEPTRRSPIYVPQDTQNRSQPEAQPLLPDPEPAAAVQPEPSVTSIQPRRLPPLSTSLSNQMSGRFKRSGPYKIPSMSRRRRAEWTSPHEEQWLYREPVFQHLVVPMAFMNDVITFIRDLGGEFERRADLLEVVCHMA